MGAWGEEQESHQREPFLDPPGPKDLTPYVPRG